MAAWVVSLLLLLLLGSARGVSLFLLLLLLLFFFSFFFIENRHSQYLFYRIDRVACQAFANYWCDTKPTNQLNVRGKHILYGFYNNTNTTCFELLIGCSLDTENRFKSFNLASVEIIICDLNTLKVCVCVCVCVLWGLSLCVCVSKKVTPTQNRKERKKHERSKAIIKIFCRVDIK